MRKVTAPVLALTNLLALGGFALAAGSAAAASCSTVTITGPVVKTLVVSSATVPVGGCVVVTNDALATVTVTVSGRGFSASRAQLASLASSAPFTARTAGHDTVSAVGTTLVLESSGSGSLTVTPAAKPTTTPTRKPTSSPGRHPTAGSTSHPAGSGGRRPAAGSGSTKKSTGGKISALSAVPAVTLPPFPHFPGRQFVATRSVGTAPLIAGQPTPVVPLPVESSAATASPPTAVVLADVSSPVRHENRTLPLTIAILMVLVVSTAYARTVLPRPVPVDNREGRSTTP